MTHTTIDLANETLLRLSQVPKRLPPNSNGRRIHVSTVHRWVGHGLESLKISGVRYTSIEALQRYADRCTIGDSDTPIQTTKRRQNKIQKAEAELQAAGIG